MILVAPLHHVLVKALPTSQPLKIFGLIVMMSSRFDNITSTGSHLANLLSKDVEGLTDEGEEV